MVAPDEAAAIAHVSPRTIYRWSEIGSVHFAETPESLLLVCRESLVAATSLNSQ
jgi:predicted site-specific integrase-resolvase